MNYNQVQIYLNILQNSKNPLERERILKILLLTSLNNGLDSESKNALISNFAIIGTITSFMTGKEKICG